MATQSLVFEITAPTYGLAYEAMPTPDFVDAFQLEWRGKGAQTPTELARQLFQRAPRWIVVLLQLRNWLGRLVGLTSTLPPDPATATGGQATITTVVDLHNSLGRWYFALIRPMHKRLVPALLRHNLR